MGSIDTTTRSTRSAKKSDDFETHARSRSHWPRPPGPVEELGHSLAAVCTTACRRAGISRTGLAYQPDTRKPGPKRETRVRTTTSGERESQLWTRDFKVSVRLRKGPVGWISPSAVPKHRGDHAPGNWATSSCFVPPRTARSDEGPRADGQGGLPEALARSLPASVSSTVASFVPGRGGRPARTARVQMAAKPGLVPGPPIWRGPSSRVGTDPGVGRAGLGARAACGGRGAAGVEPAQLVAGADPRRNCSSGRRVVCLSPPDRGLPPGGEDGCGEEDLRIETAEAMLPMLGVLSVVAVRMLQLRW